MLFGREHESARIDEVIDAARRRRSGALVVRGEAGIGKTALMDAAVERAEGMRVLRALGVESEVDIVFSGLHELLRPALSSLDAIPDSQAAGLRSAMGLRGEPSVERLAVFGGTLSLLSAVAEEQPLLCVIDDAQWLDEASAAAMGFVARRLDADGIAVLFGVREPDSRMLATRGIAELRLGGLDRASARQLLAERLPPGAGSLVVEQLIETALGNPLVLVELSASVAGSRLTVPDIREPLGAGTNVELGFARRVAQLPGPTRRALLVVAASDVGDLRGLAHAFAVLGLDWRGLAPAQEAGLVTLASSVAFCHPLARSSIYGAAEWSARQEVHNALAVAADAAGQADRRAWHLAAAAEAPDERIASALVATATSARTRGGVWSEARALERAARLTPGRRLRALRLASAGDAAYRAGRPERADALLQEAVEGELDLHEFARTQARRAYVRIERGQLGQALDLMVAGADELAPCDPRAAATLLTNAATAAEHHRLDISRSLALAERAWELAGDEAIDDPELCHIVSFHRLSAGRVGDAVELARRCADLVEDDPEGRVVVADAASTLLYAGEHGRARRLVERAVTANRRANALGDLGYALHICAQVDWYDGHLQRAYGHALEAVQIVGELGIQQTFDDCLARLAFFEAVLGRESDSRRNGQRALESALRLGDRKNEVRSRSALGMLALATGDLDAAVSQLAPAVAALEAGGVGNANQFRIHPDLVEAYARSGRTEHAKPVVASLERQAVTTGIRWTLGAAARCRALLLDSDTAAESAFEDALALHEGAFEHARTELCFGERIRRRGRRRDSRVHLGAALEAFESSGAIPWAERAGAELRASGVTPRRRQPGAPERLTPQELQIAQLVAEGKSNRAVAAALFVTAKTVEFHLTHIYRKLEIHSRSELVRRMADERPRSRSVSERDSIPHSGSAQRV
ncbi:MAG TPA: AAA family ATPase [Gaiellaceae bacterium]|nr:AAA family ATPase [Gaiellaceae bacterium]